MSWDSLAKETGAGVWGRPGVGVSLEVSKLSFSAAPLPAPYPCPFPSLTSTNLNSAFPPQKWCCGKPEAYRKFHGGHPQCGSLSRHLALRPRTNLTRSVMQEPTTTTAAASSSSCQGLPGSPDAAITNPRSCSTRTLPFALCLTP